MTVAGYGDSAQQPRPAMGGGRVMLRTGGKVLSPGTHCSVSLLSQPSWQWQVNKEALTLPGGDSTLVNYYSFPPDSLCISQGGRIIN